MRKTLQKFIFGIAHSYGCFAADSPLGTWKLNMKKSKFTPSAPVKSLTARREVPDDGVQSDHYRRALRWYAG
jgi:hypothetical protein